MLASKVIGMGWDDDMGRDGFHIAVVECMCMSIFKASGELVLCELGDTSLVNASWIGSIIPFHTALIRRVFP